MNEAPARSPLPQAPAPRSAVLAPRRACFGEEDAADESREGHTD